MVGELVSEIYEIKHIAFQDLKFETLLIIPYSVAPAI